jgi:predicted metal-dependent phosphoesterase TrpH
VQYCLKRDLEVIAIADHDTTDGIAPALKAAQGTSLTIIPAIEISTDIPRAEVHLLGYFIDHDDPELLKTLEKLRLSRVDRARRMVIKLADLGMPVEWKRVVELAQGGVIGRPHVAQALSEKGHVATIAEAFAKYIGRNGPAYVERYKLTPVEAVDLVNAARGVAGLAHPIVESLPKMEATEQARLEGLLSEVVPAGLVAMEAYYPGYTPEIERYVIGLCNRHGLVPTGGSDYHGVGISAVDPGTVEVPRSSVDGLRAAWVKRAGG